MVRSQGSGQAGAIQVEEAELCPMCNNVGQPLFVNMHDRLFGLGGEWSLRLCQKCGIAWVDPRPAADDVERLYSEYCTHGLKPVRRLPLARLRTLVKASILKSHFGYACDGANGLLGSVLSLLPPMQDVTGASVLWLNANPQGRLLDVGCGNGKFLANMRQHDWDVTGVEPDQKAAQVARERFGLDVKTGTLTDAAFPDGCFDVVTLNHVIEHVSDPVGLVSECRRVLKPGGTLVVATPNIGSFGRQVFGKSWLGWDPPRHLFLFMPESLGKLVESTGLEIAMLRTSARSAGANWAYSRQIRDNGSLVDGFVRQRGIGPKLWETAFGFAEHALNLVWPFGEEVVLMARK